MVNKSRIFGSILLVLVLVSPYFIQYAHTFIHQHHHCETEIPAETAFSHTHDSHENPCEIAGFEYQPLESANPHTLPTYKLVLFKELNYRYKVEHINTFIQHEFLRGPPIV